MGKYVNVYKHIQRKSHKHCTACILKKYVEVEQFANAIEQAYQNRNKINYTVNYTELHGKEMEEFMDKVAKKYNG